MKTTGKRTMNALVLESNSTLTYKKVPIPERPKDDTFNHYLVRVKYAGICGSDIGRAFNKKAYYYPLIMGHEFSGVIEEAFKGAKYKKGDRVTAFPLIPCMKCRACRTGNYAQCKNYDYIGSRRDGAFAEFLYIPEINIFPVPDNVRLDHAALTEPAAVALKGIRKLGIKGGETAVVYGAGTIGNLAAQWLKILGCGRVVVVDIDDQKLEVARRIGLTTVNSSKEDPVDYLESITGGEGANYAVEACGLPVTYRQALLSVSNFGRVAFIGNLSRELKLTPEDMSRVLRREIQIFGTWNSDIVSQGMDDWSTVLKFMDNKLNIESLITHRFKLEEGKKAFDTVMSRDIFSIKVIFEI